MKSKTAAIDHRTIRLAETIREEMSELIGYEMSDPRVASVIVTEVQIGPDRKRALIRVAVPPGDDMEAALAGLEHGKPFLKRELAARLDIFRVPELYFEVDSTALLGDRLQHLLKRIKKGRPRAEAEADEKNIVE